LARSQRQRLPVSKPINSLDGSAGFSLKKGKKCDYCKIFFDVKYYMYSTVGESSSYLGEEIF
jgi:hypothetical protein